MATIGQVLTLIDSGAFGRVEKVQLDDGSVCARKVFAPVVSIRSAADVEKLQGRFKREIAVQRTLPERLFVPILGQSAEGDDPPWFLMPLCERTLVSDIADHNRARTLPSAALHNILDSLKLLEERRLVHRDVKPSNVLLHEGRWKLSDFGLVSLPTSEISRLTSTLSAWGTEAYCAPEQRISFSECTWKADQYSFGCILHDIAGVSPRIPYHTHTAPGRMGKIIERCTAHAPERRFKSVSDLRAALLAITDGPPEQEMSPNAIDVAITLANADMMQGPHHAEIRALMASADPMSADAWAIFSALSDENLELLATRNRFLFDAILKEYARWCSGRSFSFDYCSVVAARLVTFFRLGTINQKASIALRLARFARENGHEPALEKLFLICGPDLESEVARRIVRDIQTHSAHELFRECADLLQRGGSAYHSEIEQLLSHFPTVN